jgi:hypothetical protein
MHETTDPTPEPAAGEAAAFVLAYAAARGWKLTRNQLERRHRAGVIARPEQHGRGRGSGTVSVYPSGTAALLVEGLELGGTRMPLRELAFELWLRGRPVPIEGVRAYLLATAHLHDRVVAVLRVLGFGRAVLPMRALRFVEQIVHTYASGFLRTMRRRLGSEERVETVIRAGIEMATGTYTPPSRVHGDSDDERLLVEIALGLQRGRTDAPTGLQPWLTGSMSEVLVDSSRLYAGHWARDLQDLSDAELERGREHWLQLRQFMDVLRDMREIFGPDIFGMGSLVDGYALARPLIDAAATFALARQARSDPTWQEKYGAIAAVCAQWRAEVSPQLPGLRALRAFPPTAALFTTRRLRPTLSDASAKARWEVEARDIGLRYQTEIKRVIERATSRGDSAADVWLSPGLFLRYEA